jgi:response regulator RpfG family c-di-GMP phosphodiesterase/serine/threonine protein kinase
MPRLSDRSARGEADSWNDQPGSFRPQPSLETVAGNGTAETEEAEEFVYELLGTSLLHPEDWQRLTVLDRESLLSSPDRKTALGRLQERGLLTRYQAERIAAGSTFGLVLGNYRVLERLGAGGMAVVYKAEHIEMRHLVAVKVLPMTPEQDPRLETRFSAEMRAVARLRHPNIVAALDAGRAFSHDPDAPVLWYLVMEYVSGLDLHDLVCDRGRLPVARACNLIHQIAAALAETNKFGLVHRDIKPSNIMATAEDQAKLLDFGLSCRPEARMTQPGTVLGTVDFMAPEQARDASAVDIRADLYSLGGTLFWCLTGHLPFPCQGGTTESLLRRLNQPPPSVRSLLPDLPTELDTVLRRMLATRPEDRYPTPEAVMAALLPFLKPDSRGGLYSVAGRGAWGQRGRAQRSEPNVGRTEPTSPESDRTVPAEGRGTSAPARILIVDDEVNLRAFCREVLQAEGLECDEAPDGPSALAELAERPYDLVLLDINMPRMTGPEVLARIRRYPPSPNIKVVLFSGQATIDDLSQLLLAGADDFLTKPFSLVQLLGRIHTALRLKEAQDRSDRLNADLAGVNAGLESLLSGRDSDLTQTRNALMLSLSRLVEHREARESRHLQRLPRFCRVLAEAAATTPTFAAQIDGAFIELLVCCAPLHDIGKVGLPDHILLKPGKLSPDERVLMQAHTTIGAETLESVAKENGTALGFLRMAIDIVRYHHERYDGTGYPDQVSGTGIPLAARIVAICDVYDALRCRRSYKPALGHAAALQLMTQSTGTQFDPALMEVFLACAGEFERIYEEMPG